MHRSTLTLLAAVAAVAPLAAQDTPLAYRGVRLYPGDGPAIESATLVVHKGKVVAAGRDADVAVPAGAESRDGKGLVVIPGLVDTHSHIGIYPRPHVQAHSDGNEMTGPVQPGIRALDAVWPDDPGIRMANAGGVTTANIMPGSGNVIGGQTVYVKLRGRTIDEMQIAGKDGVVGGLKMANGENPKGYGRRGSAPATRMKVAALQREQFVKAREYKAKWDAHRKATVEGKKPTPPDVDLSLEPLLEVLERKRTVHFHCHRADDILTAVRLSEEFGFELVLQHCTEGYRVSRELAERRAWVSLTLLDSPGGKLETAGLLEENAAILAKAGVTVAINTDDFITESRFLLRTGSLAVRGGMTTEQALAALTANPARMMHLDHRLGTLGAGKDADFVVLSGEPFSVYTQVLETFIDGRRVYQRADRRDWSFQAGGFALGDASRLPPTPPLEKPLPVVDTKPGTAEGNAKGALLIFAGRLHTAGPAGTITSAAVYVRDGKVVAVGKREDVKYPPGTPTLEVPEVTPGLIDAHSVVPLTGALNIPADQDHDEAAEANHADLRVLDAFHPDEPLLAFLRDNGVTLIHATPGRSALIAGQTGVFRTHGRTATQMAVKFPASVLANLGESVKGGKAGQTRMATAGALRSALLSAREYARKRDTAEADKKPAPNLKLDPLADVLAKKLPLVVSAHRADDLLTALRIGEEFGANVVLSLATEGYLVADRLAAAKVPVVVHPTMQRVGGSMETFNSQLTNAAVLAGRGVPLAIGTSYEGYVPKTRVLRAEAAVALANGLGRERTLRAITLDAAKLLGVADRFGSIEPGKVADFVLYDGDPFENTTHVLYTVIDGQVVFDRAAYLKLPFERRALPLVEGGGPGCCLGAW
jgi:imidazolonepropionase-like amidohydrolase